MVFGLGNVLKSAWAKRSSMTCSSLASRPIGIPVRFVDRLLDHLKLSFDGAVHAERRGAGHERTGAGKSPTLFKTFTSM